MLDFLNDFSEDLKFELRILISGLESVGTVLAQNRRYTGFRVAEGGISVRTKT